jgi:hypothetical protein
MNLTLNPGDLHCDTPLPPLSRVRQLWNTQPLADAPGHLYQQLEAAGLRAQLRPGARIAVTAGSRGICDMPLLLRHCVEWLRAAGAEPFIVPAMGSHGGATAEGQLRLLAGLGISSETMGCPIHSSMDVVELGQIADGTPVFMDRQAAEADGVLLVNRIKAHTSFKADIESGLAKMAAIGLGKRRGAEIVHSRGMYGLREQLVPMARTVVECGKVLAGVAIIEDAHEQTADIAVLPPAEIGGPAEAALLERSKTLMARLPFAELDVLVVDEIGKQFSGTGMDTNVIGRLRINGETEPSSPRIAVIAALDVAAGSQGNANGVGLADLIPLRMAQKIDFAATYINTLTSGLIGLRKGALPITLPTVRDTIAMAIKVCGRPDPAAVRLVRIPNTLNLEELLVSPALLPEVEANANLAIMGSAEWEHIAG